MSSEGDKPPEMPNDPLGRRNIAAGVLIGVIVVLVTLPVVIIAGAASNLIAKDPPIPTFTSAPTPTAVATTERVVIVTATSDVRVVDTATVAPPPSPIPPTPTNELPIPILQPTELPKPISTQPPTTIPVVPTDLPSPMPPPVGGIFADLWLRHKDDLGAPLPENQSDRSFPAYTFGRCLLREVICFSTKMVRQAEYGSYMAVAKVLGRVTENGQSTQVHGAKAIPKIHVHHSRVFIPNMSLAMFGAEIKLCRTDWGMELTLRETGIEIPQEPSFIACKNSRKGSSFVTVMGVLIVSPTYSSATIHLFVRSIN